MIDPWFLESVAFAYFRFTTAPARKFQRAKSIISCSHSYLEYTGGHVTVMLCIYILTLNFFHGLSCVTIMRETREMTSWIAERTSSIADRIVTWVPALASSMHSIVLSGAGNPLLFTSTGVRLLKRSLLFYDIIHIYYLESGSADLSWIWGIKVGWPG